MKQFLLKALFSASLLLSTKTINAQCSLDQVGASNYSTTCALSDMAVSPTSNVLYTVSYNTGAGGKYFLHSAVTASSWTLVASLSGTTSIKPIVSVSKTGKVYMVIKDDGAGEVGKVFYESAGSFVQLGTAFSGINKVSDLSIAFNSLGEEYVAYTDITNGNIPTVKKWNGASWVAVGTGTVSSGAGYYNSLIIDKTDAPVLAFEDMSAGNKVTVTKFNGATWNVMTSLGTNPTNTKLKLGQNGDYYVGYTESTGSVVVQRYNGSVWGALGSPVTAMSFSANTFDLDLDPNDLPYFICQNNTSLYAVGFKYNGGASWINVIGGNLTSVTSNNLNVGVDKTGSPYFFYVDQPGNNGLNVKTITSPISISSQPFSVSRCNGQSGSFSVGTVGGVPTGYQWQTLGAGTYTNSSAPYTNVTTANIAFTANTSMNQNQVRCVINVGCKNIVSNTPTLTVNTLSVTSTFTNPTCFNTGDGAINSNVTGGTTPYSYTWSPVGGNVSNPTGLYWNTYTLTTSDINGCSASATVTLTSPPSISTSFSGNMNICSGSNTTLTITAIGGTPGYTYSWTPGASLSSTTSSVVVASPGSSQTYNVSVTDAIGCVDTNTVMVNVTASPTITASPNSTICNGSSATINASGAHTYTWNPGNLVGASQIVFPVSTTNYTVVGTNTLTGCTNSSITMVTVNSLPIANAGPTRTLTCANTSTTLAGSGGGTYSWTGSGILSGATTANPTINLPGCYTLVVTAANSCTASAITCVTQNTTAPTTNTNVSGTLNCTLTSVNASATTSTTPVTYNWTGSGITSAANISTITVNAGGIKNFTVTNIANGCVKTGSLNVSQNLLAPSCTASSSGTVTCVTNTVQLNGTPGVGVTYTWTAPSGSSISSGVNSQNAIGDGPGTYSLMVTMISSACTNGANVTVNQNTVAPSANAGLDQSLTCASPTVSLIGSASPSSCTPVWTGGVVSGANSYTASASTIGTYTLTVTNPNNGCSATDNVQVTANTSVPTITVSVGGTLTCSNTTVNTSATTSATLPTYLWSGPSIVSGIASANAIVDQPGVYTVTVTDIPTSCSATANINVIQDITVPSITVTASPTVICAGNSSTLTTTSSSDPNTNYTWSPGSLNGPVQNVSPLSTTLYSVVATNTLNGCAITETVNLTVNPNPTITISGNMNICNGSTTNLTAGGATSYTWNNGTNTNTISVTPTVTTTYTVNGDNGNGCVSSLIATVSIITNKSITGVITNTAGATGGDVTLHRYTSFLSQWDSITTVPLSSSYSFNNIDSALYVIRVIPSATNMQVTYADSAISWQGATIINHGCTNNTNQNIKLIPLETFTAGPGVLTGTIYEDFGFGLKMDGSYKPLSPGQPIGGIVVKGGKNPGGQMMVQTITSSTPGSEGTYTLSGLPLNSGTESYFIIVDIPGLDTNGTYHVVVMPGATTFNGLDFKVDSIYINPIGFVTGLSVENSVLDHKISLFPNPASQKFTIEYELTQSAKVLIEVYDVVGQKAKTVVQNLFEEKNKYTHSTKLEGLSNGVYFVKVKINDSETTIKLIITN